MDHSNRKAIDGVYVCLNNCRSCRCHDTGKTLMPEVSEHTASMFIEDEHSVEDGFASGEATRKSQEERPGTLVSEEPAEDDGIIDLAQKLLRALHDMEPTQLHSEEPQRNNRDKSYDDEQAMEFQVLVMSLPNGSEALSQWLEKETIRERRFQTRTKTLIPSTQSIQ